MDIEKVVNSKWFSGFEWMIRLLFLNLLTVLITLIGAIPFVYWYFNQDSSGLYVLLSLLLMLFAFIPTYSTVFYVIKYYKEEKTGSVFKLYFIYLWDTLKRIYKAELIMISAIGVLLVSGFFYWNILSPETFELTVYGVFFIIGCILVFFVLISIFFSILQFPMIVSNFRMKTMGYIRLSLFIAFKYILKTILHTALLTVPVLIMISYRTWLLELVYLLYGFSVPLYIMYFSTRDVYFDLSNRLEEVQKNN